MKVLNNISKLVKTNFKKVLVLGMLGVTVIAAVGCGIPQEEHDSVVEKAIALESQIADLESQALLSADELVTLDKQVVDLQTQLTEKDQEVLAFAEQIAAEEKVAQEEANKYVIDELALNEEFSDSLTDKEVTILFDGDITFDGEEYDAVESLAVSFTPVSYATDFNGQPHLTFEEESVYYAVYFDGDLDTSLISEDETLEFSFLGEAVEVVEWSEDEITFTKGTEHFLAEGDSVDVDGVSVSLIAAGEDFAYVSVGGESEKIYEGETEKVNGMEVKVEEVLGSESWKKGLATLKVGEEVSITVESGEEYEDDSEWSYHVGEHELGLVLTESFVDADEDEEFPALKATEELTLPNSFLSLTFDGLVAEDQFDYKFSSTEKDGETYVKVKGEFTHDLEDYDKLYVSSEGIFDEDLELLSESSIELDGPEDLDLELSEGVLSIADVSLSLDWSSLVSSEEDVSDVDEDVLSSFGILVDNPEDSLEDESVSLTVPEEQAEVEVSVKW